MKRIGVVAFVVGVFLVVVLAIVAMVGSLQPDTAEGRMQVVYSERGWAWVVRVYVDTETGQEYLAIRTGGGVGLCAMPGGKARP